DRVEHLQGDVAVLVKHVAELRRAEDEATERRQGSDGRAPRAVVEEGDLAEEVTRAELALPVRCVDIDAALDDDDEVPAALPALAENLSGGQVDLVGTRRDEGQLFVGAAGDEGDAAQQLHL